MAIGTFAVSVRLKRQTNVLDPHYGEFQFYVSLMRQHGLREPVMLLNDSVVTVGVGILFLHKCHALNDNTLTERPFQ